MDGVTSRDAIDLDAPAMNYPVTDDYLAERLARALEELPRGSMIAEDIRALATFFALRDAYARLTLRDQEKVCELARHFVERDEAVRRENEQRKRMNERVILKDNGGSMTCPSCGRCRQLSEGHRESTGCPEGWHYR